ncbi:MAG: hypothetical protein U0941_16830 [Planctomycetaceae bacterium]
MAIGTDKTEGLNSKTCIARKAFGYQWNNLQIKFDGMTPGFDSHFVKRQLYQARLDPGKLADFQSNSSKVR